MRASDSSVTVQQLAFGNRPEHHHYRAFAALALATAMLASMFYLFTSSVIEVKVTSGVWFFYLVAAAQLAFLFAYYLFHSILTGWHWYALAGTGLALLGTLITLLLLYRPFSPGNFALRMGFAEFWEDVADSLQPGRTSRKDLGYGDGVVSMEKDWTQFAPSIIDQGECGSCWAVSTAFVLSTLLSARQNNVEDKRWHVSPQFLLDKLDIDARRPSTHKCERGGSQFTALQLATGTGALSTACVPYYASKYSDCSANPHPAVDGHLLDAGKCVTLESFRAQACYTNEPVTGAVRVSNIIDIKSALPSERSAELEMLDEVFWAGPILAPLNSYPYAEWRLDGIAAVGEGFVARPGNDPKYTKAFSEYGGHLVAIVGYGTTATGVKFWKVANSWGPKWGNAGYTKIERGVDAWNIESRCAGARLAA